MSGQTQEAYESALPCDVAYPVVTLGEMSVRAMSDEALTATVGDFMGTVNRPGIYAQRWFWDQLDVRNEAPRTPSPDICRISKAICMNEFTLPIPNHPWSHKVVTSPDSPAAQRFWELDETANRLVESFFDDETLRGALIGTGIVLERYKDMQSQADGRNQTTGTLLRLVGVHPLVRYYNPSRKAFKLAEHRQPPCRDPALPIAERLTIWTGEVRDGYHTDLTQLMATLMDRPYATPDEVQELRSAINANSMLTIGAKTDTWYVGEVPADALTRNQQEAVGQATQLILDDIRNRRPEDGAVIPVSEVVRTAQQYGICGSTRIKRAFYEAVYAHPQVEPVPGQPGSFRFRQEVSPQGRLAGTQPVEQHGEPDSDVPTDDTPSTLVETPEQPASPPATIVPPQGQPWNRGSRECGAAEGGNPKFWPMNLRTPAPCVRAELLSVKGC